MPIRYFDDVLFLGENNARILSEKPATLYSLNHKKESLDLVNHRFRNGS